MDLTENAPTVRLRIGQVIRETETAKSFVLEIIRGKLEYKAGQFLTLLFTSRSGKQVRRSYSISSSPYLDEPLRITVKRIVNGEFSRKFIDRTHKGEVLETIGASGFFILPSNVEEIPQFVFIAAGSGITPVFSLIKTLLYQHPRISVLLIYSNTETGSTIFYRELTELQSNFTGRFVIEFLFSRLTDIYKSRLTPDLLEALLLKHLVADNSLFYVCGPPAYMRMVNIKLLSLSIPPNHIRREIFVAEKIIEIPKPPDTGSHTVNLQAGNRHYSFTVQYPVTILQAAKLLGIPIPYSCEAGQCGTCAVTCASGEIWMAQNQVLVDKDIAEGKILTCTGFPINGDAVLIL